MENLHVTRTGLVILNLNGRRLTIGQMRDDGRTFVCERADSAVMRVNNSLGFNWYLMSRGTFHTVLVFMSPSGRIFKTTRENIVRNSTFLEFRRAGMERQCFFSVELFNRPPMVEAPVIIPARPTIVQPSLFGGVQ